MTEINHDDCVEDVLLFDVQEAIKQIRKPGPLHGWVKLTEDHIHRVKVLKGDVLETLEQMAELEPDAVIELTRYGAGWIIGF